ncbi:MAG TPA: multicopper oxidase domain-containing protein [Pyrinomonadaceae bacterium]|nr:multicopper oxidase domain-containing protein [Pyrinomonadaceae bacterium]
MAFISKRNRKRERDRQIAAKNRRELVAAHLDRRELLKMGLLTSAGLLVPKVGLSARPLTSAGYRNDEPQSPPTTPFVDNLPLAQVLAPVPSLLPTPTRLPNAPLEQRTVAHQDWFGHPPQKFYEMVQAETSGIMVSPDLPGQTLWTFNGQTPGPQIVARYGEPILVRQKNQLPLHGADGFGMGSVSTHLHNGHTPPESDGHPCYFFDGGHYYDYHYPMVYAGGDVREAMHTLWYHDHRFDHTAENTYKGLAGTFVQFNEFDTGDETTGFRLPSHPNFDIYMAFNDKVFDEQTGRLAFDSFNFDGVLGDKFLVNGKINPVLHVSPRRYRFRWLNTGPARFYQFFILDPTNNSSKSFWQISTDGNFLERPVQVNTCRVSVAERVDVIVDFTGLQGKTFYIENRLEQVDGRGPTGDVLPAGAGDKILKIVVDGPVVPDNSINPATITQPVYFYQFPDTNQVPVVTRTFKFERNNGQWSVNGRFPDCAADRFAVKRNTAERWIIQNNSGGWQHPIHVHFEEFQTLSINGRAPRTTGIVEKGRKDVFRLEHNQQAELYFRFRDYVGRLPMHCHNVLHEDHAMMVLFQINDQGDTNPNP